MIDQLSLTGYNVDNEIKKQMQELQLIEKEEPFYSSCIWKINQDYYSESGIEAWTKGVVPHHITSNANVGKIYARLLFSFLKDQSINPEGDPIYFIELGAGHGRLAFHILTQLEELIATSETPLPRYCYVLTDIAENNLEFFASHPQFQSFFQSGRLDVAFFDGSSSTSLALRFAKKELVRDAVEQSMVCIANYFFDSIPMDLFHIDQNKANVCSLSTYAPDSIIDAKVFFKSATYEIHDKAITDHYYQDQQKDQILKFYADNLNDAYILFPSDAINCINTIRSLSKGTTMVLVMDKGFHEIHDLDNMQQPDMITHGSISFWVNFHALAAYCSLEGGQSHLSSSSTFNVDMAALIFDPQSNHGSIRQTFKDYVDDFGPDDLTALMKLSYRHLQEMSLPDVLSMVRLMQYDSTFFINMLGRIKQLIQQVTFNERYRLLQAMHHVWNNYFLLESQVDLAFEMGGICYDLAFYKESVAFFKKSEAIYGESPDLFYNMALAYYQLRMDDDFASTLRQGKKSFPDFEGFKRIEALDLDAI